VTTGRPLHRTAAGGMECLAAGPPDRLVAATWCGRKRPRWRLGDCPGPARMDDLAPGVARVMAAAAQVSLPCAFLMSAAEALAG
jgi:hypothetical protein